jgi:hypothetical protein
MPLRCHSQVRRRERHRCYSRGARLRHWRRPLRFPVAVSLAAACLVPLETTSISAFAQQEIPTPALPTLPPGSDAPPESAPPATPPAAPAHPRTVRVHLVTNAAGVQFLFRAAPDPTSTAAPADRAGNILQYSASCLAPCDLELPAGDYFVALSRIGGQAYEQAAPVSLRGATTIEGTYESHSGMRVTGIVLLSTLVPIGSVIALVGATASTSTCTIDSNGGPQQCTTGGGDMDVVALGLVALGFGLALGIGFVLRHDDTAVQVVQATGSLAVHGVPSERPVAANGLALRFSF